MTKEEAKGLNAGDMVFVPQKGTRDWPESYNEIVGDVYPVHEVGKDGIWIKHDGVVYKLYFEEVEKVYPEVQDNFDDFDIKLLFGGET